MNILPGEGIQHTDPDGFLSRTQVIDKLTNYANTFQLPVQEHSIVSSVTKTPGEKHFAVNVQKYQQQQQWISKQVVIASGALNAPEIPSMSKTLTNNIQQIHVANYHNTAQLRPGAVMIIGGGQSGCQVAEDLVANGRKVYLSSSRVGRVPRRHRGKDIFYWLTRMNHYDTLTDAVSDPGEFTATTPLVSGVGKQGRTISLQSLHEQGVTILGRLKNIEDDSLHFTVDAAEHIRCGDAFSEKTKAQVDKYIADCGISASESEPDEADLPDTDCKCDEQVSSINCTEKNIHTVIWTTGFTGDFSWIKLPVLNDRGNPLHTNGISSVPGLYFIGFPWLRSRKSGILYGMADDTEYIGAQLVKNIMNPLL